MSNDNRDGMYKAEDYAILEEKMKEQNKYFRGVGNGKPLYFISETPTQKSKYLVEIDNIIDEWTSGKITKDECHRRVVEVQKRESREAYAAFGLSEEEIQKQMELEFGR